MLVASPISQDKFSVHHGEALPIDTVMIVDVTLFKHYTVCRGEVMSFSAFLI